MKNRFLTTKTKKISQFTFFLLTTTSLSFSNLNAQTGPGGVGSSSNNVLWLRADKGVYNDNGITNASNSDNVYQWQDASGNGKNAIQTTASNRPNYYSNQLNGLPIITFTGSNNDFLESVGVTTNNRASVWTVASYNSLPTPNPGIIQGRPSTVLNPAAPGDKSIGMWVNSSTSNIWGRGVQSNGVQQDIPKGTTIASKTFFIANNIYRSNRIDQYVNSSASNNNSSFDGTLQSWSSINIGMQAAESWDGNIAEVIVFNIELNNTQRIIIDNYLSAKYNLPLSSNKLYVQDNVANGGFSFEVAGIGRISSTDLHTDAEGSSIIRINNAQDLNDNEFFIWGHSNGDILASDIYDMPSTVKTRMGRTWRINEVNNSGTGVDVGAIDITWDLSSHPGPINASDLVLLVDNDGDFSNATTITGATNMGGRKYKFSGVTALSNNSYFTLGSLNSKLTPLPIELLRYDIKKISSTSCTIQWVTVEEVNNDYFTLSKSIDGIHWVSLAFIPGTGNSHQENLYEFIDNHTINGVTYYKLTQTDIDGTTTELGMRILDNRVAQNDFILYPTSVENNLYINAPNQTTNISIAITDFNGRSFERNIIKQSDSKLMIDMSAFQRGVYCIKIISNHSVLNYKVIKE